MKTEKAKNTKKRPPPVIPKPGPPLPLPPPPAPVQVKPKSQRSGLGTKIKTELKEVREELKEAKEKLQATEVNATHLVTLGGGAIACTGAGVVLVRYDLLSPLVAGILLTLTGVSAAAAGYYYDSYHVMSGGCGWLAAALGHTAMAAAAASRSSEQKSKPRNGAVEALEPRNDARESLRLSEERRRELERELAKARRRLNPEAELAAA